MQLSNTQLHGKQALASKLLLLQMLLKKAKLTDTKVTAAYVPEVRLGISYPSSASDCTARLHT